MLEKVIDFVKKHKKGCVAVVTIPIAIAASIIANAVGIDATFSFGGNDTEKRKSFIDEEPSEEDKAKTAAAAILSITDKAKHYSFSSDIIEAADDICDIAIKNGDNNMVKLQAIQSLGVLADKCSFNSDKNHILKLIKMVTTNSR